MIVGGRAGAGGGMYVGGDDLRLTVRP
jgi:hypothetical protein